jgi:hypothetical protein
MKQQMSNIDIAKPEISEKIIKRPVGRPRKEKNITPPVGDIIKEDIMKEVKQQRGRKKIYTESELSEREALRKERFSLLRSKESHHKKFKSIIDGFIKHDMDKEIDEMMDDMVDLYNMIKLQRLEQNNHTAIEYIKREKTPEEFL